MKKINLNSALVGLLLLLLSNSSCKKDPVVNSTPTTTCEDIVKNTTWSNTVADPSLPDIIVSCEIHVTSGNTLTIDPGVKIQFTKNTAGLYIDKTAIIKAVGTAAQPIIFEGSTHTKGFWQGIYHNSNDANSTLAYVKITDAGSGLDQNGTTSSTYKGGLIINNGYGSSQLALNNSELSNNAGFGIVVAANSNSDFGKFISFGNNKIINNEKSSIAMDNLNSCTTLDANSDLLTGNGIPQVDIMETINNDNIALVIPKINTSYLLRSNISYNTLKLLPGVTLEFVSGAGIENYYGYASNTIIDMQGTAANPITLKGQNGVEWNGIMLTSAINSANIMTYCNIDKGTGHVTFKMLNSCIDIHEDGGHNASSLTMNNCTISNSPIGIALDVDSKLNGSSNATGNPAEGSNTWVNVGTKIAQH